MATAKATAGTASLASSGLRTLSTNSAALARRAAASSSSRATAAKNANVLLVELPNAQQQRRTFGQLSLSTRRRLEKLEREAGEPDKAADDRWQGSFLKVG